MIPGQILVVSQSGLNHLYPYIEGSVVSAHVLACNKSTASGKGYVVIRIEEVIPAQSRDAEQPMHRTGAGLSDHKTDTNKSVRTDK